MQSPPEPVPDETPFTTPVASADDRAMSPTAAEPSVYAATTDPLVSRTAARIADAINDFKRELDKRDGAWASAHGTLELCLRTGTEQAYELSILPHEDGPEFLNTVHVRKKERGAVGDLRNVVSQTPEAARHASDDEIETDFASRKKRKLDDGDDPANKKRRSGEGEGAMPLITKEHVDDLLSKLREDIQDDTAKCVDHIQTLLRRFKDESHDRTKWNDERVASHLPKGPFRDSVVATPGVSFPSPSADRDDTNASFPELLHRETKLLSAQIRWVEECRRVAADSHGQREETWRTTSAGFHDRNRQDRENFQTRILHETGVQSQTLHQILNEVKAIGLYTQSMKWETPTSHLSVPPSYPPPPTAPVFPTQPSPPVQAGRGRGAGSNKR